MNHLRYVVLHHQGHGEPHFDLMLELDHGSALTTWRIPSWPVTNRSRIIPLDQHRREYLEYEGPLTGNRGQVSRMATGFYERSVNPEFNTVNNWAWEINFLTGATGGLLLRRWLDSNGKVLWDIAPM